MPSLTDLFPRREWNEYLIHINDNGKDEDEQEDHSVTDFCSKILEVVEAAKNLQPEDIYVFVHGWNYDYEDARENFTKWVKGMVDASSLTGETSMGASGKHMLIGIHWNSKISWGRLRKDFRDDMFKAYIVGGGIAVTKLMSGLHQAGGRIHIVGHSFGTIVASRMIQRQPSGKSVHSAALINGAVSCWSFTSEPMSDYAMGKGAGQFKHILELQKVAGPLLVIYSRHDRANGRLYPLGIKTLGKKTMPPTVLDGEGQMQAAPTQKVLSKIEECDKDADEAREMEEEDEALDIEYPPESLEDEVNRGCGAKKLQRSARGDYNKPPGRDFWARPSAKGALGRFGAREPPTGKKAGYLGKWDFIGSKVRELPISRPSLPLLSYHISALSMLFSIQTQQYNFQMGKLYNLDGAKVIKKLVPFVGAHQDFKGPEVANAIWQAIRCRPNEQGSSPRSRL
ncbi:unnamed protein product [Chrysoparadoxa australica]